MGLGHLLELSHSPLRSHLETRDGGMGVWASPAHGSEGARSPRLVFADAVFPVQQPLHEELDPFRGWSVPPGNYTMGSGGFGSGMGRVWGADDPLRGSMTINPTGLPSAESGNVLRPVPTRPEGWAGPASRQISSRPRPSPARAPETGLKSTTLPNCEPGDHEKTTQLVRNREDADRDGSPPPRGQRRRDLPGPGNPRLPGLRVEARRPRKKEVIVDGSGLAGRDAQK